ncbi:hypothetical protein DL766_007538 [Monosporascus sp. MC13-8B]|uniref:Ubiquitin carrier protein n=1 Tax=Monosporascus cannonballus TaxID=155416 RepID=A0ABY0H5R0_9PEZI|nr:hypothetical protein DL762_005132 [Monosporascus cannonballus]RYO91503.1 hypothetical protein DL763_004967 [Monosporascus cannonballus]RYP23219.1 hypothetical protein DL766_007538 [Monosporascus sp. MC13-8B]
MSFQLAAAAAAGLYKRSNFDASDALGAIAKRSAESGEQDLALRILNALVGLVVINIVLWLPVFIFLGYTVGSLFPALAIVEDESPPPSYERVSLKEDVEENDGAKKVEADVQEEGGPPRSRPVTSGFFAIFRLLHSIGGWRSLFRGFWCATATSVVACLVAFAVCSIPYVPDVVGITVSSLATVQLSAVWLHIVVTAPSPQPFWRRLPGFGAAFRATAVPTLVANAAVLLAYELPAPLLRAMGFETVEGPLPGTITSADRSSLAKILVVVLVELLVMLFFSVPACVVLTRCQAYLLPAEDASRTVVPFDSALGLEGEDDPRKRGYVTILDAWRSFSRAAWRRLVVLYVKITMFTFAVEMVIIGLFILQARIVTRNIVNSANASS